ncbi:hypothetical protein Hbl1158_08600 [Halobaculum sp. CBA1158]|uniref:hypothetical protein n=1 Tax=Halobaculum sp. CBA1158 TaxID=2904243 RepID=UPI001F46C0C1|nr:hypothetical protein [Halobaculum sp. CBA1158]UIO98615.1 hypothetical protein Hbl1158_08600 [Halobaculum sp. CBA1158]
MIDPDARRATVAGAVAGAALVATAWAMLGVPPLDQVLAAYALPGAAAVGAAAGWARATRRLVTPGALAGVTFAVAVASTWRTYVAPEIMPTPVGPTPLGWLLLSWPVILLVAVVAGGGERLVRARVLAD